MVEWWSLYDSGVPVLGAAASGIHVVVAGLIGWAALVLPLALGGFALRIFRRPVPTPPNNRIALGLSLALLAASPRMLPSVGPRQGLHPKAKAAPSATGP